MKKLAIIFDGFTGRTKREIEEHEDFYFLPLQINIDGKDYADGVDKTREEMTIMLNNAKQVTTSQPSPANTTDLFERLSKEYEHVIYLPVGTAMSSTYKNAFMFAKEFKNVYVMNNTFAGLAFINLGKHLQNFIKNHTFEQTIEEGERYAEECVTYVIPKNIDAIIRSGRLGKAAQLVLQRLHVVPILGYDNTEIMSKKMVKRSGHSAVEWAIEKLISVGEDRWGKGEYYFYIQNTQDKELGDMAVEILKQKGIHFHVEFVSAAITAGAGDGSIGITVAKRIQ